MKWILCNDRMPDNKGAYLTTDELGIVETTHFDGACIWFTSSDTRVIAWMPLPDPATP